MSRAFVREDADSDDVIVTHRPPLPPGVENLVTPQGLAALEAELALLLAERNRLSGLAGDAAAGAVRRLAALDEEIPALEDRVQSALVVQPPADADEVTLGATVTVLNLAGRFEGQKSSFTIVGVDQADPLEGLVAFTAPVAQALLGRRVGEQVTFEAGDEVQSVELVAVAYG